MSPLDLRLVGPALVAWAAALAVVRLAPVQAWSGALACVLLAAALVVVDHRGGAGRPSTHGALALALLAGAAVLGAGGAHGVARTSGPLPSATAAASSVTLSGTVAERPTLLPPAWSGASARSRVTLGVDAVAPGGEVPRGTTVVVLSPADWSDVAVGTRVAVTGRLAPTSPGDRAVALVLASQPPRPTAAPSRWRTAADAVRDTALRQAARLPGDAGALLPGVTVGDTGGVPADLRDALRASGLAHLTAVSGAHFALLSTLVLACAGAARLPRAARAGVVAATGAALVLVVGPSPSVLRAAAMGVVATAGLLVGRPSRSPAALAVAVLVLLTVDPWLAGELGFVLSVVATGGLVLLGVPMAERWRSVLPHPVATGLAAPVAAQLVCAPVLLAAAPSVAVLAVPANLLAAPAVAPATVLGLAGAVVGPWWPALGHVLALLAGAACWWIAAVARWVADAPGSQLAWAPGAVGMLQLAGAGASAVHLCWPRRASDVSAGSGRLGACPPPHAAAAPPARPVLRARRGRTSNPHRSCS